jgi:hypothetical protein
MFLLESFAHKKDVVCGRGRGVYSFGVAGVPMSWGDRSPRLVE